MGSERDERRRRETEARRAARRPSVVAARKRRRTIIVVVGSGILAGLAVVLVVILVVAGGGDGEDAAAEPARAVSLEADEYSFVPNPALGLAGEIELTMSNVGDIGHELIVLDEGVRISAASQFDESTEVGRIDSIAGGDQASTTVDLEAGTYQIVCLIGGHLESGMTADLIVS